MVLLERVNEVMYVTFFYDEDLKPGSWPWRLQNSSLIAHFFPFAEAIALPSFTTEANSTYLPNPVSNFRPHLEPKLCSADWCLVSTYPPTDSSLLSVNPGPTQTPPQISLLHLLWAPLWSSPRGAQQEAIPLSPGAVSLLHLQTPNSSPRPGTKWVETVSLASL